MYAADARHPNKTLQDKLQSIYGLRGGPAIDLTIRKPYRDLLAALGNPQDHLPPVIHVAGTNGKGSVIAMLRAVFEEAGYNVHAYTSPHLLRFNERIRLAGTLIDDSTLEALLDEVLAANDSGELTFFEITTVLAFCAFARTPADICLLETGLGGRLDCTNVIEKPLATVITAIGYDHMEFLGDTLEKIAAEKAGIIKPGVPCITGPQSGQNTIDILQQKAQHCGSPFFVAQATESLPRTNLAGPHQRDNVAIVQHCLQQISGFNITQKAIKTGLLRVEWPARLQQIFRADLLPDTELWIDGGHNESAGKALAAQAVLWAQQDSKPLHLMIGMMSRKDPLAFVTPIAPYLSSISCLTVPQEQAAFTATMLADLLSPVKGVKIQPIDNIDEILTDPAISGSRILITGSFYLLGALLAENAS